MTTIHDLIAEYLGNAPAHTPETLSPFIGCVIPEVLGNATEQAHD